MNDFPWCKQPQLLFAAGHSPRHGGYLLAVEYGVAPYVKAVPNRRKAFALIARFNRLQWRKWKRRTGVL